MIRIPLLIILLVLTFSCSKKSEKDKPNKQKIRIIEKSNQAPPKKATIVKKPVVKKVKPLKKDNLKCLASVCYLSRINKNTKTVIESKSNYENIRIIFNKGATNEDFNTISTLAWIKHLELPDSHVTDISVISKLKNLSVFKIRNILPIKGSKPVVDLAPLGTLKKLKILDLHYLKDSIKNIKSISKISTLEDLTLWDTKAINLTLLSPLVKLKKLELHLTGTTDISPVTNSANLHNLLLSRLKIDDFAPLSKLKNLKRLNLTFISGQLKNLSTIKQFKQLEYLIIQHTPVKNLAFLRSLTKLTVLKIPGTAIKDIKFVTPLKKLIILDISSTEISNLTPLSNLKTLVQLNIKKTKVKNLNPVKRLNKLKVFSVDKKFKNSEINRVRKANPKLKLF
jgi:internalin A